MEASGLFLLGRLFRERLFRRISANRSPCASALLINGGSRLTSLVRDVASGAFPQDKHLVRLDPKELELFRRELAK